jgi:hypothetical protein
VALAVWGLSTAAAQLTQNDASELIKELLGLEKKELRGEWVVPKL